MWCSAKRPAACACLCRLEQSRLATVQRVHPLAIRNGNKLHLMLDVLELAFKCASGQMELLSITLESMVERMLSMFG